MDAYSVAFAPLQQVAIDQEAIATVQNMDTDEIQAFRKSRLREAIDQFFDGKNINLARELRNKDGKPLKDGSYVGHLLKPSGEPGSRPLDEDRIREIESLRPALRGWFSLGSEAGVPPNRPMASTFAYPQHKGVQTFLQQGPANKSLTNIATLVPEVVSWDRIGDVLSMQHRGDEVYSALAIPGQFSRNVQVIQYPDDSLEPEIQSGELIAVDPGIEPWPGDIVVAGGKATGQYFAGRFVSNRSGGFKIRTNKPDRYADADHNDADVVAVMVARLSGRSGTPPAEIRGL